MKTAHYGHTFGIRVEADIHRDLFARMPQMSFDFYDANRIISIADGIITECGTHEELVDTDGIYSQLYKTQNAQNWR